MSDLIDRQAAIDALHVWEETYTWDENCLEDREKVYAPSEVIEDLPAADPEIVRCKDCKHLFDGEHNANCCALLMRKAKWLTEITVDMNGYCADGERRTDE